jgi:hypothetical protein
MKMCGVTTCGTPHPGPPPQGGREKLGKVAAVLPRPLDGGGSGWGWGTSAMVGG